jgi:hypothetical protein
MINSSACIRVTVRPTREGVEFTDLRGAQLIYDSKLMSEDKYSTNYKKLLQEKLILNKPFCSIAVIGNAPNQVAHENNRKTYITIWFQNNITDVDPKLTAKCENCRDQNL